MFSLISHFITVSVTIASVIFLHFFPQHMISAVKGTTVSVSQYAYITTVPTSTISVSPSPENITTFITPKVSVISSNNQLRLSPIPPTPMISITLLATPQVSVDITASVSPTISSVVSVPPTISISSFPTPILVPVSSAGLNADLLFSLVNDYRSKNGLPSLKKDDRACSVANARAPQVFNEIFISGAMDSGLKAMNLPYWVTENIINDDTEKDAVNWWTGDTAHRQVILGNYIDSCVACSGYSCVQIFTNFIAK